MIKTAAVTRPSALSIAADLAYLAFAASPSDLA